MQDDVQPHPDRSRQSRAGRHRAAVPFLLRRQQPPARGRADRHGRHGGDGEPADRAASAGRSISSTCRCRATARTTPISRRSRRSSCRRAPSFASAWCITPTASPARAQRLATAEKHVDGFLDRDRMRLRPAAAGDHPGTAAHSRRGGGRCMNANEHRHQAGRRRRARRLGAAVEGLSRFLQDARCRARPTTPPGRGCRIPSEPMFVLGAYVDGKLLGIVHYLYHRSCWTIGDYCYLQDLFVARGQPQARARPRADRGGLPGGARRRARAACIGSRTRPTRPRARSTTRWPTGPASSSTGKSSEPRSARRGCCVELLRGSFCARGAAAAASAPSAAGPGAAGRSASRRGRG